MLRCILNDFPVKSAVHKLTCVSCCVACDCDAEVAQAREEVFEQILASEELEELIEAEVARRLAEVAPNTL